jgi:DNA-binding transcriptional LysR family regulator
MNILHMKYAVEVAHTGSLSKASDMLFIAQPNLSRAIKELEAELGITIFERTSKGMTLTPQGKDFIVNAERILREIRDLENLYIHGAPERQRFAISVPRASYIAAAFARFSKNISKKEAEIFYMETNARKAVQNLLEEDYRLGIVRMAECYEPFFSEMFEEKGISCEELVKYRFRLAFSKKSPLAEKKEITLSDLTSLIEVTHADPFVPSVPFIEVIKDELTSNIRRHIFVFERASTFDLISENPETFMWAMPLPDKLKDRFDIVERECVDNTRVYKDVLIYRRDYRFTDADLAFLKELDYEIKSAFGTDTIA